MLAFPVVVVVGEAAIRAEPLLSDLVDTLFSALQESDRILIMVGISVVFVFLGILFGYFMLRLGIPLLLDSESLTQARNLLPQFIPDLEHSRVPSRFSSQVLWIPFIVAVVVGLLPLGLNILRLPKPLTDNVANLIGFLLAIFFIFLLGPGMWSAFIRDTLVSWLLDHGPARAGNYEEALRRIESFKRILPQHFYHFCRGLVLKAAGRHQEAEHSLREGLKTGLKSNTIFLEHTLNQLGYMLLAQEHYYEALLYFEAAVRIWPESSNTYASLADVYLYQGIHPERALELIDRGITYRTKQDKHYDAAVSATRAWAFALLGRHAEANESLKQTLAQDRSSDMSAEIYYIAGQVKRVLSDSTEAIELFKRVRQLEPVGIHGDMAERALQEMSASD